MNEDVNNGFTEDLLVQQEDDSIQLIRFFDDLFEQEGAIRNPKGLVVLPNDNLLAIERPSPHPKVSNEITTDEEIVNFGELPAAIAPINTAFDRQFNRLLSLNHIGNQLTQVQLGIDGTLDPDTSTQIDVSAFGIQNPQGMTVTAEGTLYVLDDDTQQIVGIEPGTEGSFETATVFKIDLPAQIDTNIQGIALEPITGHFQILSPAQSQLYEVSPTGELVETRDLSGLGLKDPQAIVFNDSADSTDDPQQQSLYIADQDLGIAELSMSDATQFIRIRFFDDLFEQEGAIRNPKGLVVLPNDNLLAIERPSPHPKVSNEITTNEEIVNFGELPAAIAPINTAFDRQFNRLLGLNFKGSRLMTVELGADGTLDPDTSTEINVASFGIQTPQGMTVAANGTLYVLDSDAQQIVVIEPGAEGNFETATISEIDLPAQIDTKVRGIALEPITGHFQILSPAQSQLYEVSPTGQLVTTRDLSGLGLKDPQAIVFNDSGDSTDDPQQQSLYIADQDLGIAELSITDTDTDTNVDQPVDQMMSLRFIRLFDDVVQQEGSVKNPEGLVVLPDSNLLVIEPQSSNRNSSNVITTDEELVRVGDLPPSVAPINTAFDRQFNRLLGLNPSGNRLIEVPLGADGAPDSNTSTEIDARSFGIQNARGITVAADGTLYVLDGAAKQIVAIQPGAEGDFETGIISKIDLPRAIANNARGIALDPSTGNFQILSPAQSQLYEVSPTGQLIATRDLSKLGLQDPQAIVFNDSGDSTDDPQQQSLYVADKDLGIVELSLIDAQPTVQTATLSAQTAPFSPQTATLSAQTAPFSTQTATLSAQTATFNDPWVLEQTIDTSQYTPPSSDPSGITYISSTDRLIISDAEINETVGIPFQGVNIWEINSSGGVEGTGDTTAFSDEPTGISFDPNFGSNGRFFISDDIGDRGIYVIDPGSDGLPGGGDDTSLGFINTSNVGSADPEGVTYGVVGGQEVLFIADGVDNEVYKFDLSGQLLDNWDTTIFGLDDPEGIEFDPVSGNLFLIKTPDTSLFEVTIDGTLVNEYDISAANLDTPAGVALAPNSTDPSRTSVYIVDRGIDNNTDPNAHNDGKVYEVSPPPPPPAGNEIYVSFLLSGGSVGGVSFNDEDILRFRETTGTWDLYFDGGDVGVGDDIDAFHIDDDGSILLSLSKAYTLPDVGLIEDSDIVRFIPTSLGNNTAGSFEWFFDGSDVGLDDFREDINAIGFAPDGRLVISTLGAPDVITGVLDEDLLIFDDTSLGETTSGTWDLYFDGSDVGLSDNGDEQVYGTSIDSTGEIYLTTRGAFAVSGVSGDEADIFAFDPSSTGATTSGLFSSFFDGSANGLTGENIDGFYLSLN
jgi:streptogramin lyase